MVSESFREIVFIRLVLPFSRTFGGKPRESYFATDISFKQD